MNKKNQRIKFNNKLTLDELSKIISVDKNIILNNVEFLDFKINPNKKIGFKNLNKIAKIYGFEFYKKIKINAMLVINIILFIVLSITTTCSVIVYVNNVNNNNKNKVDTGTLNVNMVSESGTEISLHDTYPISDEKAKELVPFIFTISNSGTLNAKYRISLVDYSEEYKGNYSSYGKLDYKYIRYSIQCENNSNFNKTGLLSDLKVVDSNKLVLINSKLKSGIKNNKFLLKLWIDSEADNNASNKYFVGKVMLESDRDTYEK